MSISKDEFANIFHECKRKAKEGYSIVFLPALEVEFRRITGFVLDDIESRDLAQIYSLPQRISASLLALEFQRAGISAVSICAHQTGIKARGNHLEAEFIAIDLDRLTALFHSYRILVFAGIQGLDDRNDLCHLSTPAFKELIETLNQLGLSKLDR